MKAYVNPAARQNKINQEGYSKTILMFFYLESAIQQIKKNRFCRY
jgi:hypothetical protein